MIGNDLSTLSTSSAIPARHSFQASVEFIAGWRPSFVEIALRPDPSFKAVYQNNAQEPFDDV
jgi:hypothetical protein